jgi:hypothetical protein
MRYLFYLAVLFGAAMIVAWLTGCASAPTVVQSPNLALSRQDNLGFSIRSAVEKQECFDALTDPNRYRTYPRTCIKCLREP